MEDEVRTFTAKEMEELSKESQATRKQLFKAIREYAKQNRSLLYWCFHETDKVVVEKIIWELGELGYNVTAHGGDVLITWGTPYDNSTIEKFAECN